MSKKTCICKTNNVHVPNVVKTKNKNIIAKTKCKVRWKTRQRTEKEVNDLQSRRKGKIGWSRRVSTPCPACNLRVVLWRLIKYRFVDV